MQKADFEKNVQDKMHELRFKPSQEVWTRIESNLEKKRRRVPAFFWMLGAAIILAGGSYFLIPSSSNKNLTSNKQEQPGQSIATKQNEKQDSQNQSNSPTVEAPIDETPATHSDAAVAQKEKVQSTSQTHTSLVNYSTAQRERKRTNALSIPPEKRNSYTTDPLDQDLNLSLDKNVHNTFPFAVQHGLVLAHFDKPIVDSHNMPMNESTTQLNNPPSLKKTNWRFGISVSAGASDLGKQLLFGPTAAGLSYYPQSANSGGSSYGRPSDVIAGAAFSIGAYAMKSISDRWKLGAGIHYQYFSNSIKVGDKVDSTVFLNQNNLSMDRVNGYYKSNGSSPYHNKYHFISIPVTLQWQFAKRFNWENQFIYARMVGTNALHFDGVNRAYYENESLFNKNQFSYSTSVLFGFKKDKFQIGPQLYYAFSNLLRAGDGEPKHLRSIGIKSNIELWKN